MTDPDSWRHLSAVEPPALREATHELHQAVQLLAAAGQTFVAPRDDDGHRAMTWDASLGGFLGDGFSEGYPFRLGLDVEHLRIVLLDRTDAVLGDLPLGGVTLDDAYVWLRTGLSQYMGGTGPVIERPDFEIPVSPVGEGAPFSTGHAGERRVLTALYASAAELLEEVARSTDGASPVRCWPHHFDIATLVTVRPARGEEPARTVGVGMAPMGGGYESWYWYVTPWPYASAEALAPLTAPAFWHTEGWTGAVLLGADVVAAPERGRRSRVAAFVDEALRAATTLLAED